MRRLLLLTCLSLCCVLTHAEQPAEVVHDWAQVDRYRAENEALGAPRRGQARVVFLGDSITDFWPAAAPDMFANRAFIGRGISGQTTPQMLARFRSDVLSLHPRVVVILAGTNDIAGNTGPTSNELILDNLASMVDLARAHGIRVVLASVLPASRYDWAPNLRPAARIAALNEGIRRLATRAGCVYLDYYSSMADAEGGLPKTYAEDGVHPNAAGYEHMRTLAEPVIARALR